MSAEMFRRVRLGDLSRLLRHRHRGELLSDDDAGREDLEELLFVVSLGSADSGGAMKATIRLRAPWLPDAEANLLIASILRVPRNLRMRTARDLGDRMNLLNAERKRLHLKTIKPADMTDEQLAEQRMAQDRDRKRQRRKRETRQAYLAKSKSTMKPWELEGLTRRTWYRRQSGTGVSAVNLTYPDTLVPLAHGLRRRLLASKGSVPPDSATPTASKAVSQHLPPRAQAKRTHLCHPKKRELKQ